MAIRSIALLAVSLLCSAPAVSSQNTTSSGTPTVRYGNSTASTTSSQGSPAQSVGLSGQAVSYPYTSTVVVGANTYTITQQSPLSVVTQAPGNFANVLGQTGSNICPGTGFSSSIQYIAFEQVATAVGQTIRFSTQVTNYSPAKPTSISSTTSTTGSAASKTLAIVNGLLVEIVNGVVSSINGQILTQSNAVIVVNEITIVIELGVIVTVNGLPPVVTASTIVNPDGSNVDAGSNQVGTSQAPSTSTTTAGVMSMLYSNSTTSSGFQTSLMPSVTPSVSLANNSAGSGVDSNDRTMTDSLTGSSTSSSFSTSSTSISLTTSTNSSSTLTTTTSSASSESTSGLPTSSDASSSQATTTSMSATEMTSTTVTSTSETSSAETSTTTTSGPQPTQLVVNPSFEAVDGQEEPTLEPWTVQKVYLFDDTQEPAHTGTYSVFPQFDVYGPHTITQTITGLTPGEPYTLEYWLIRWAGGADSCSMQVSFDDRVVDDVSNAVFIESTSYTARSITVVPTGPSADLLFAGGCTDGYDSVNIALDDITLTSTV